MIMVLPERLRHLRVFRALTAVPPANNTIFSLSPQYPDGPNNETEHAD